MNDPAIIIFLIGGLFLGWSLGANDAANVFGTAVGSRMVRFTTAALICGIFVILGAVISGTGTSLTLGKLGAVNALGGSFMAALAAGPRPDEAHAPQQEEGFAHGAGSLRA